MLSSIGVAPSGLTPSESQEDFSLHFARAVCTTMPSEIARSLNTLAVEAMECHICMDAIFPCENFCESECYPVRHMCHWDCYNAYLQATIRPTRCPVCRQVEISELDWIDITSIFGLDSAACVDVDRLPEEAQNYARSFQRGEITQNELRGRAESLYNSM